MSKEFITSGYLEVKISTKVKRGFTPWKAWKKLWCEIKRIDNIDNGVEIKLKNSAENNSSNCFLIPRNATICRTESRTKRYSFGIFGGDRQHKPLLFLAGTSETDSQLWMISIRSMLSISSYLPVPDGGFYVSIVDNDHSRIAGLAGLHGILTTNSREVLIKDPATGDIRTSFSWYQLHQFHLAATGVPADERKIVVLHTSREFRSGAGQLHIFSLEAPRLLQCLVARGKVPRIYITSLRESRRLSRSEGDLRETDLMGSNPTDSPTSPVYYRSHSGSEDSGVRVSMASDDSSLVVKCKKAASFISLGFGLLVATPGGSEIDTESQHDLLLENVEEQDFTESINFVKRGAHDDPRRESGVSITSGVYEEIPDIEPPMEFRNPGSRVVHTYEDPVDVILGSVKKFTPPPLPPRRDFGQHSSDTEVDLLSLSSTPKVRRRNMLSHSTDTLDSNVTIDLESEYMVMTPAKAQSEDFYMPMSAAPAPADASAPTPAENMYMVMTGKATN